MSVKQLFLATSAIALVFPFTTMAETADPAGTATTANPKAPVTHEEFSAMVREALLNNPEMIVEAIKKIHDKQVEQTSKDVEKAITQYQDTLFKDSSSPSVGDEKTADITLVEFFDYHCGYCKRMLPTITQLTQEDKKVRVLFRELPILAEDSTTAARAAIAVSHLFPAKYFAFHTALMNSNGAFDDKSLSAVAKQQDLDWSKIRKEMDSKETNAILDKNHALAEELGIRGTPAIVIGKQILPGAVPYEDLRRMVDNARSDVKTPLQAKPEASTEKATPPN